LESIGDCEAVVYQAEGRAELICHREGISSETVENAVRDCTDPPGNFIAKVVERKKDVQKL